MGVEKRTREVFYAPTAGRHFFTKKAAIRAEAIAMVSAENPKEKAEHDDDFGRCTYPGYQLPDDEFWPLVHEKITELNGVKG